MTEFNRARFLLLRRRARIFVIPIILIFALFLGACQFLPVPFETLPEITNPGFSIRPTSTGESSQPDGQPSITSSDEPQSDPTIRDPSITTTLAPTTSAPAVMAFDEHVGILLLSGLQQSNRSIKLDDAIKQHSIPESDIQQTIDRVFSIYQRIFAENPEYIYLNGSVNVSYQVDSNRKTLVAMTLKPDYWPEMADLSKTELDSISAKITSLTKQVADDVSAGTQVPWEQLAAIHDFLIRHIVYDESLDQNNNHVYSALFRQITLCQGYAQSFQLIARQLGFEIRLITGVSDGLGHAWNLVRIDGRWYHIDATFDDPTPDRGSIGPIQYVHFLRSDSVMRSTHIWNAPDWPASLEDGAHYYRRQAFVVENQDDLRARLDEFISSIDYNRLQVNRLQLLFTGSDLPQRSQLDEIVQQALRRRTSGTTVYYSSQVIKGVVMIDISPGE